MCYTDVKSNDEVEMAISEKVITGNRVDDETVKATMAERLVTIGAIHELIQALDSPQTPQEQERTLAGLRAITGSSDAADV